MDAEQPGILAMGRLRTLPPRLPQLGLRHQGQVSGSWEQSRRGLSSAERGYGHEWRKTRERILQRDCGLCQACAARQLVTAGTEVDHKVNRATWRRLYGSMNGCEDDSNLQLLCKPCHAAKTRADAVEGQASASPVLGPIR